MHRAFHGLDQVFNLLVTRTKTCVQGAGLHDESLSGLGIATGCQALAQQIIYRSFERLASAPDLVLHQRSDIVVYGESGSHIMMLWHQAS